MLVIMFPHEDQQFFFACHIYMARGREGRRLEQDFSRKESNLLKGTGNSGRRSIVVPGELFRQKFLLTTLSIANCHRTFCCRFVYFLFCGSGLSVDVVETTTSSDGRGSFVLISGGYSGAGLGGRICSGSP